MAYLILIRHGESEWNAKGAWTGLTDISLSEKGRKESQTAGQLIKDIPVEIAFTSVLKRARETLDEILNVLSSSHIPIYENKALNERDYGDFTGKNKWDLKKQVGEEKFLKIRRSWDLPPPNGESLKDVYNRVIPYYKSNILPKLKQGKNVLISAHGNSLRALVKYLEKIPNKDIPKLEIATGAVYVYKIGQNGKIISKNILS